MEKQILEIMNECYEPITFNSSEYSVSMLNEEKSAKAIASLFGEFIEWFAFGSHPFIMWYDNGDEKFFSDEISEKKWSIDDLFNYWFENIKTK